MYALATNTTGNITLVACDEARAKDLPGHAEFWATIFYSLSQFAFLQNAVTGRREKLPCFSDPFWTGKTSTGLVWASNISITSKGFNNEAHVDNDLSSYTFVVSTTVSVIQERFISEVSTLTLATSKAQVSGSMLTT